MFAMLIYYKISVIKDKELYGVQIFAVFFYTGDNFCDFSVTFLAHKICLKRGLH